MNSEYSWPLKYVAFHHGGNLSHVIKPPTSHVNFATDTLPSQGVVLVDMSHLKFVGERVLYARTIEHWVYTGRRYKTRSRPKRRHYYGVSRILVLFSSYRSLQPLLTPGYLCTEGSLHSHIVSRA